MPSENDELQTLEKELDADIVAVEPVCKWADLTQEQLAKLQSAEKDMGVLLLAYDRGSRKRGKSSAFYE
jgi:hypothetical protein